MRFSQCPIEIGEERARPAHAALEEREVQLREAPRDAAEEDGLGHRLAGGGEVADVVVAEVRRRVAEQDRARAVVEARRDAQLAELRPHRVVVVLAVDGDRVVPLDELRGLRVLLDERGDGAADQAAHHHDPIAELARRELELLDRLLGRVHRDDGRGNEAIAVRAELVHREHVVGAAEGAPQLVRRQAVVAEPGGRIDHGEVEPEVVQALVEEARHHRGRAVQRVLGRQEPERLLPDPAAAALGHGHASELGMRALASASASTAVSPPIRRNSSRMCGANSAQWPSASMIGCFRLARIFRASFCPLIDMATLRGQSFCRDDTPM